MGEEKIKQYTIEYELLFKYKHKNQYIVDGLFVAKLMLRYLIMVGKVHFVEQTRYSTHLHYDLTL